MLHHDVESVDITEIAILRYLKPADELPDPKSSLSYSI